MDTRYYYVIGLLAIVIHLIINTNHFIKHKDDLYSTDRDYRIYLVSVFVYYVSDMLWGIINNAGLTRLLYVDTLLYYVAMASSVVFWCRYVIIYLKLEGRLANAIKIFALSFWVLEVIVLIINHFVHIFFWFDEHGNYQAYFFRYAALIVQVLLFASIALISLGVALKTKNESRGRNFTIAIFGFAMFIFVIEQTKYPLQPLYTIGLLLGTCVLHVFVKEAETEDLQNSVRETDDIISSANMGIWHIYLEEGKLPRMKANAKMRELLSLPPDMYDEVEIYESWFSRIKESELEGVARSVDIMKTGERSENTYIWIDPYLGEQYVRCGGVGERVGDKAWILRGYHYNVDAQVRLEQQRKDELAQALENAKKANIAKTTFLNSMSHDIRTPMNAIIGFGNIARKQNTNSEVAACLDKILSSSDQLLSLINEVLDISRVESGNTVYTPAPTSLCKITDDVENVVRGLLIDRQLDFEVIRPSGGDSGAVGAAGVSGAMHCTAMTDGSRICEILINLLSNAVKFTEDGGRVSLVVETLPHERADWATVRYIVSDTGCGMSPEFLPRVFDDFSQEESGPRTRFKGTGLGMAITKRYVELMGGKISVVSQKGVGTTFTVDLPMQILGDVNDDESSEPTHSVDLTGLSVLLAEDNDLNAEIATVMLEELGMSVTRVIDGQEAVDLFAARPAQSFNLILMDIMMPRMGGLSATRAIRNMASRPDGATIPIIAMTANAFEEDVRKSLEAGINAHIAKPIAIEDIVKVLNSIL